MKLRYRGPFDAVSVPLLEGGTVRVTRGQTEHFTNEQGRRLLEQPDNWEHVLPRSQVAPSIHDRRT